MSTTLLSFSKLAMSLSLVFAIGACSGVNSTSNTASSATADNGSQPVEFYANQVGFLPQQQKHMHGVVKRRCIALENSASIDCLAVNLIWFHEFISIQPLKFEASVLGRTKEKIQII